jgi:hypothetical protein
MLGAHAFVNVLAFYRDVPRACPELELWCAGQTRAIVDDLEHVRPLLANETKLTPLGRALAEPLLAHFDRVAP